MHHEHTQFKQIKGLLDERNDLAQWLPKILGKLSKCCFLWSKKSELNIYKTSVTQQPRIRGFFLLSVYEFVVFQTCQHELSYTSKNKSTHLLGRVKNKGKSLTASTHLQTGKIFVDLIPENTEPRWF